MRTGAIEWWCQALAQEKEGSGSRDAGGQYTNSLFQVESKAMGRSWRDLGRAREIVYSLFF